uniref:Putative salivary lipocalin n=1 Tax=Ixodes ricinus TaxID=34613 RepID=A0A0K8R870_IXORI
MFSVLVLALCLLISGGISEDDVEGTSTTDGELEETTLTTLLSGPVFNYSETNPELQNYQDAWKFVTSNESFLMTYRNFNTNPTGENTTSCVTATMIEKNETTNYVLHNVTFLNMTSNKTVSFTKSYYVISSECYTTKNVLNGTVFGTNTSELYPFAFADKNCAVIRKDSWSNGNAPRTVNMRRMPFGVDCRRCILMQQVTMQLKEKKLCTSRGIITLVQRSQLRNSFFFGMRPVL